MAKKVAKRVAKKVAYDGPVGRPCTVEGCTRRVMARGLCARCYEWARQHGATPLRMTPAGRVA